MKKSTEVSESVVILGLNDQLPVIDESTTSRVVVSNPLMRVVVFTFGEGQVLTEHTSPRAVVVTLLEGEMQFDVDGEPQIMKPGDVIYLAPDEKHAVVAITDCRMQLVMVDTSA